MMREICVSRGQTKNAENKVACEHMRKVSGDQQAEAQLVIGGWMDFDLISTFVQNQVSQIRSIHSNRLRDDTK